MIRLGQVIVLPDCVTFGAGREVKVQAVDKDMHFYCSTADSKPVKFGLWFDYNEIRDARVVE